MLGVAVKAHYDRIYGLAAWYAQRDDPWGKNPTVLTQWTMRNACGSSYSKAFQDPKALLKRRFSAFLMPRICHAGIFPVHWTSGISYLNYILFFVINKAVSIHLSRTSNAIKTREPIRQILAQYEKRRFSFLSVKVIEEAPIRETHPSRFYVGFGLVCIEIARMPGLFS